MKNVIFDFDGTIAQSYPVFLEYASGMDRKNGKQVVRLDEIKEIGLSASIAKAKIPPWKIPVLLMDFREFINKRVAEDVKIVRGLSGVIKSISKNYLLGILSSNAESAIRTFLAREQLSPCFKFVYSGSSLFGKHIILDKLCKRYNLAPEETFYVGDEDRDIIAAKKAGLRTIAVDWGYNSKKLLKAQDPDFLISSARQLREILPA